MFIIFNQKLKIKVNLIKVTDDLNEYYTVGTLLSGATRACNSHNYCRSSVIPTSSCGSRHLCQSNDLMI